MASMRKKKKSKKFSFRKLGKAGKAKLIALLTAAGIAIPAGIWGYNQGIDKIDKGIEYDTDDLDNDLVIDPIEEEPVIEEEPTIEDNDVVDESLEVEEETILDEKEIEEIKEEVTDELEEEKQEDTETESLEISKDKGTTITSYSLDDLVIPVVKNFEDVSIVNVLNEIGYDYSISSRARLAVYFNIVSNENEFTGTPEQNTTLLECLREYARNLQTTAYNDYANAVTDNTISNSTPDNNTYNYSDNSYNYEEEQEEEKKDHDKDDDHNKDDENEHIHQPSDSWGSDETGHWHICKEDGEKIGETVPHTFDGTWTDTADGRTVQTCSVCGYEKECKHDLDSIQWTYSQREFHRGICPTCGKEVSASHRYGEGELDELQRLIYRCSDCGYGKKYERKETTLNKSTDPYYKNMVTDDHCKIVEWKNEIDEIDESIPVDYLPHTILENQKPEYTNANGDVGYYKCIICDAEFAKKLDNTTTKTEEVKPEDTPSEEVKQGEVKQDEIPNEEVEIQQQVTEEGIESQEEQKKEELIINFEFNLPLDQYEFMDEEEPDVDFQPPEVKESTDLIVTDEEQEEIKDEIKQIEQKEILQLEDKKDSSQDANKDNTTNIIASFDKELYKELFKGKVALEQSLATLKGIEREEKLQLLNDINAVRKNMVQDLANALVQEELNKIEKGQSQGLIFKM